MVEITQAYAQGTPCWIDLMAKDQKAAMDFYKQVFGWEGEAGPDEFGGYAVMTVRGKPVAGIGPAMAPEGQPEPPHVWTTYLASKDADTTSQKITDAGGTVLVPAMDVGDLGRMAIAADPTGGVFGYWQPKQFFGAVVVNEPGGLIWNECNTRDVRAAKAFYESAFGVKVEPMEDMDNYYGFKVDDRPVAAVQNMGPEFPEHAPAHWMTWFSVNSVDAALVMAEKAGARVLVPASDQPFGRIAALADPWGAVFGVMQEPAS